MYHQPVMLKETTNALVQIPDGVYVDITFGGGGHSKKILELLSPKGRLFGFDQDSDAQKNAPKDERFTFVKANFRHLKRFLKLHNITEVDGILADFGVSSHQIDTAERGFSTRFDGDLDMRMDQTSALTASDVLNTYSFEKLVDIFSKYGEVINSKMLARKIEAIRTEHPFRTTEDLLSVAKELARGKEVRYLAQVFQAIRIEVNDELGVIKEFLIQAGEILKPGGRIVVLSYHSLEDRLVKNYVKAANFEGEPEKDFFGHSKLIFKPVIKKYEEASAEEIKENPRARSAKLRVAEKI
jgi:16S rRNA (cytosine1402-N4)-methyltransferase